MDEIYTCLCEKQAWSIHDGFIRCVGCKREFQVKNGRLIKPWRFNVITVQERGIHEAIHSGPRDKETS